VNSFKYSDAPSRARRRIRKDDILLCTVRPGLQAHARIGKEEIIPFVASTGFAVLRPNNREDSSFLYHQIFSNSVVAQLRAREVGSNYPAVNESDVRQITVFMPEPAQRRNIGKILDTIDEAIAKTDAVIAKLKQVRSGLLHDLLSYGLDDNGRLRDPITHPEQFKDSPLGRMPREWEVIELSKVGDIVTGTTPPSSEPAAWGNKVPFITPAEITIDGEVLSPERLISDHGRNFTRELPAFSVLVVCIGSTLGKVAVAPWPCVTNQQINTIVCRPDYQHGFISSMVKHHIRQLHLWAGLQAVPIVNKSQFSRMLIPVALPSEQMRIAGMVEQSDRNIQAEVNECRKLTNLKSGLQNDLLTGRVRVPESIKEGAAGA